MVAEPNTVYLQDIIPFYIQFKNLIEVRLFYSRAIFVMHFTYESEVAQSCPTLCNPVDCSLPGSSLHGILQARILEWVAISFSILLIHTL